MPYIQSGLVGDFIPEPRCSKSVLGLQTRRRKEGVYKRFRRLRLEGLRSELGGAAVVRGWCRSSESELEEVDIPLGGGSTSPFIDEGDGFTGERERVQIFLSLTAYGDKNWIMVEAFQYYRCRCRMSDVHGGSRYLL